MSKKKTITILIENKEDLQQYMTPEYPKVVVINTFHGFWEQCKCFESLIGKFQDLPTNQNRVDWLACDYELLGEELLPPKTTFGSKPMYLIYVKGQFFKAIKGLNYPELMDKIKESYDEIDKEL